MTRKSNKQKNKRINKQKNRQDIKNIKFKILPTNNGKNRTNYVNKKAEFITYLNSAFLFLWFGLNLALVFITYAIVPLP